VLYAFPREADGPAGDSRLGVSVSRKVGGAVERNAVKRALREAFWSLDRELPASYDFVLVARPDVAGLLERDGTPGITGSLRELVSEAGLTGSAE
jgi:ribonuclease P protein component